MFSAFRCGWPRFPPRVSSNLDRIARSALEVVVADDDALSHGAGPAHGFGAWRGKPGSRYAHQEGRRR